MVLEPSGQHPDGFITGLDLAQAVWIGLKRAAGLKLVLNMYIYVLVVTPPQVIWLIYTHSARGRVAPEGRLRIYQPDKEGVL